MSVLVNLTDEHKRPSTLDKCDFTDCKTSNSFFRKFTTVLLNTK